MSYALWGLLTEGAESWEQAAAPDWATRHLDRVLDIYLPAQVLYREVTEDMSIAGCPLHAGQSVVLDVPAINTMARAAKPKAARRGVRPRGGSVTFGAGTHKCPGEFLARLIIARAIPALARRFPRLVLYTDQCSFRSTPMVRSPIALPCSGITK